MSEHAAPTGARWFFLAAFVTIFSGSTFSYAFIILSRHVTGSDGLTGLVNVGAFVIPVATIPFVGPFIERRAPMPLLVRCQLAWALSTATVALLLANGQLGGTWVGADAVPVLLGVAIWNGIPFAMLVPVRMILVRELVTPGRLGSATQLLNLLMVVGFGAAPPMVGMLLARLSFAAVFGIIALGLVAGSALLLLVRGSQPSRRSGEVRAGLGEVVRYVRREPLVIQLVLAALLTSALIGPVQILVPQYLKGVVGLGEQSRGLLLGLLGVGILVGGTGAFVLDRTPCRGPIILVVPALMGLSLVVLSRTHAPAVVGSLLLSSGVCGGIGAGLVAANLQVRLQEELRGRVLSLYAVASFVFPAVMGAMLAPLSDWLDLELALAIAGGVVVAAALLASLTMTTLRRYH